MTFGHFLVNRAMGIKISIPCQVINAYLTGFFLKVFKVRERIMKRESRHPLSPSRDHLSRSVSLRRRG